MQAKESRLPEGNLGKKPSNIQSDNRSFTEFTLPKWVHIVGGVWRRRGSSKLLPRGIEPPIAPQAVIVAAPYH